MPIFIYDSFYPCCKLPVYQSRALLSQEVKEILGRWIKEYQDYWGCGQDPGCWWVPLASLERMVIYSIYSWTIVTRVIVTRVYEVYESLWLMFSLTACHCGFCGTTLPGKKSWSGQDGLEMLWIPWVYPAFSSDKWHSVTLSDTELE